MRVSWESIVSHAAFYGFDRIALVPAQPLLFTPNIESTRQGILGDPSEYLANAVSVLVAAMPFQWFGAWPHGTAEVSAFYYQSQRAHFGIRALGKWLADQGVTVSNRQELPQKILGEIVGFGTIGKNRLLANAEWGSCFALRILITDLPPEKGMLASMPEAMACSTCTRCSDACPTGALDGLGSFDSTKCLRSYMLAGVVVPTALREKMGSRLLGCEVCQRECPRNRAIIKQPPDNAEIFSINRLLAGSRSDLDEIGNAIGWNEARLQRIQAQAALIAGNSQNPNYLSLLHALKDHKRPSIAEHARWAIGKIERGL